MNGKGDKTRQGVNWKRYRDNYDGIFRKSGKSGGVYDFRNLFKGQPFLLAARQK